MNNKIITLALYSDLHKEFYSDHKHSFKWFFGPDKVTREFSDDVDVCVLAGDVIAGQTSFEFINKICDHFKHVVSVCGNHEFYGSSFERVLARHREYSAKRSNFHFLEQDIVTLEGQRFLGCTFWYKGDPTRTSVMNDFYQIKLDAGHFASFIWEYSKASVQWLHDNAQEDDVVVTHMLPCEAAIDDRFRGSPVNCFYFNDGERVIADKRPALWLHGHSHMSFDQVLGATRVVRNPLGYPHEMNPYWQPTIRLRKEIKNG